MNSMSLFLDHQPFGVRSTPFASGDGVPLFLWVDMLSSPTSPFPDDLCEMESALLV